MANTLTPTVNGLRHGTVKPIEKTQATRDTLQKNLDDKHEKNKRHKSPRKKALTEKDVAMVAEKCTQNIQRDLVFNIDNSSDETTINVLDSKTKEVIRHIAADEIMDVAQRIGQTRGVLFSGKA